MSKGPAWTPEDVETLTRLWATERVAVLALRFNRSADAIHNKGRALGLPPRLTLTPIKAKQPVQKKPKPGPRVQKPAPEPVRKHDHPLWLVGPLDCRWPLGDPGRPGFRFCGRRAEDGRPYCHDHVQRAYHNRSVSNLSESLEV